ncbi:hypothetical protein Cni_G19307 [Canna indica]|uniref:Uncharacterized protein n=1 Tax=Canna indica TaxID=4628 RepID=A0AAQ3KLZ2_9LILI|nr:hypothetical protein Cni_G19307 [Canna indica]
MKAIPSKFDDVRANGWLDAMRSSSPPRKQHNWDTAFESNHETDLEYHIWMKKHPSTLKSIEEIASSAKCEIALFLDYDGTLSPIVDDPNFVVMSNAVN